MLRRLLLLSGCNHVDMTERRALTHNPLRTWCRDRVRHDFRKAQHETDPARIQFLLQLAETQLDNVLYALNPSC